MGNKNLAYAQRAAAIIAEPANAVGRIKKAYGDHKNGKGGELLVTLYDTFSESFLDETFYTEEPLWVEIDTLAVPLFIGSIQPVGAGLSKAIVAFDDFEQAADATMLIGKTLYSEHLDLSTDDGDAADDEAFRALIGYSLTDTATGRTGVVREFYDYPNNPLLGVDFTSGGAATVGPEDDLVLVPAADELFTKVDHKRRKLEADLPEGLFDL